MKTIIVKLKFPASIVKEFKTKFPYLHQLKDEAIAQRLVSDELGEKMKFDLFNPRYYSENDMDELFPR